METNSLSSTYRKPVGTSQTNVNASITPKGEATIGKILCVNAKACVESIEVLNGEARYTGVVNFEALFTSESGEYLSESLNVNFNGKVENEMLTSSMQPIYKVEVVEVNITHATATEMVLDCTVEVALDCIMTDNVECVVSGGENIELKSGAVKCVSLVTTGSKTFTISEEYDIKANLDKIMFADAHVLLSNVTAGEKFLTVEGEVYLTCISTVNENEQKELKSFTQTIAIKEELPDELLSGGETVFAYGYINPQNVKVNVVNGGDGASSVIKVDITVEMKYVALKEEEKQVCMDSYSLTHKINTVSDSFNVSSLTKSNYYKERIDGSIILGEEQARIAKIVSVYSSRITVANSFTTENNVNIEGIGYATVVYMTDEDDKLNSALVEIPFSLKLSNDGVTDADKCFASVDVKDVDAKTKKGKEIELEMELAIKTDIYSTSTEVAIKEIELTEELTLSEYALQIYLAPKDSSLWDIAKHLKVKQEMIIKQNPSLIFPLEKNESIVYFRS